MDGARSRRGSTIRSDGGHGTDQANVEEAEKGPSPAQMRRRSLICMTLLTVQYGAQPILTQYFSGKRVTMTSVVLACEIVKVVCAALALLWEAKVRQMSSEWRLQDALRGSALPAIIYAVQNTLVQVSYRNLDSLTATMLNQTKIAFTGLFMFLILGHRQSKPQVGAIFVLLIAATLLSLGQKSPKSSRADLRQNSFLMGVVPILVASLLSGLASTLCQWAVQVKKRSTYLMTVEMSVIGCCVLLSSLSQSPDGVAIREKGFFHGWTPMTIVPVFTNAVGGILVGLVTMYAGGIKKGFVIVSALLVTAALQVLIERSPPSSYAVVALPLVVGSTIVHQKYPYVSRKAKKAD